jgi:hypothetical protein
MSLETLNYLEIYSRADSVRCECSELGNPEYSDGVHRGSVTFVAINWGRCMLGLWSTSAILMTRRVDTQRLRCCESGIAISADMRPKGLFGHVTHAVLLP